MSPGSHPDRAPSPDTLGPSAHHSEPTPHATSLSGEDGRSGEDGPVEMGRALLAELETLTWAIPQLTALCDLIDSALPPPAGQQRRTEDRACGREGLGPAARSPIS